MKFKDIALKGKCNVCGKEELVAVLSSSMGACSFAYCENCMNRGLEPYSAIIGCYSTLGKGAYEDFANKNEKVLADFYHKTKEKFCEECSRANSEYEEMCKNHNEN